MPAFTTAVAKDEYARSAMSSSPAASAVIIGGVPAKWVGVTV